MTCGEAPLQAAAPERGEAGCPLELLPQILPQVALEDHVFNQKPHQPHHYGCCSTFRHQALTLCPI